MGTRRVRGRSYMCVRPCHECVHVGQNVVVAVATEHRLAQVVSGLEGECGHNSGGIVSASLYGDLAAPALFRT